MSEHVPDNAPEPPPPAPTPDPTLQAAAVDDEFRRADAAEQAAAQAEPVPFDAAESSNPAAVVSGDPRSVEPTHGTPHDTAQAAASDDKSTSAEPVSDMSSGDPVSESVNSAGIADEPDAAIEESAPETPSHGLRSGHADQFGSEPVSEHPYVGPIVASHDSSPQPTDTVVNSPLVDIPIIEGEVAAASLETAHDPAEAASAIEDGDPDNPPREPNTKVAQAPAGAEFDARSVPGTLANGDRQGEPDGGGGEPIQPERLRSAAEAILFVADRPITTAELAQVIGVPQSVAVTALAGLRTELDEHARGFELREIAGGWRLYTRDEFAPYVEAYVLDGQQARLTQAALETLAVVAYRQPVTRSRISAIRGVSVDGVIRTLLTRGLIEECGSEPETGGLLYRTTPLFLEKLGLQSLEELPSLAPLLPELDTVEDVVPST